MSLGHKPTNRGLTTQDAQSQAPPARELLDRVPPNAVDSEKILIGSILLNPLGGTDDAIEMLSEADFYDPSFGVMFGELKSQYINGRNLDVPTLYSALSEAGQLEIVGGAAAIADAVNAAGTGSHMTFHATRILDASARRRLVDASQGIIRDAFESGSDISELLDRSGGAIFNVLDRRLSVSSNMTHIGQSCHDVLEMLDGDNHQANSITTGFDALDRRIGGYRRREMVVVGARPGVGKSAYALNCAVAAAEAEHCVMMFSLEMSADELTNRCISYHSGVSSYSIRQGHLGADQRVSVIAAAAHLLTLPIWIDDTSRMTANYICAAIRRRARQRNGQVDLIIIDYLQLLDADATESRYTPRHEIIGKMTRRLRAAARDVNASLMLLAQVNRESGNLVREPRLSELRESGSIEQDADTVIFLHRPDMYNSEKMEEYRRTRAHEPAEFHVAKQRHGPTAKINMVFDGRTTRFLTPPPTDDRPGDVGDRENETGEF